MTLRLLVGVPLLLSLAGTARPAFAQTSPATASARASPPEPRTRLVPAPDGNEARYRVREQLVEIDFPSDAVGRTQKISGGVLLEPNGTIVRDSSRFVVDLTTIASDRAMRDRYVRRNTLETETFPEVVFVPREVRGLSQVPPAAGPVTFQLVGDLTVRSVTRPVAWDVTGETDGTELSGTAVTAFTFADFGMTKPRVRVLLSVRDTIRLEYDFHLVRGAP
ncbi:MAG: YceI family protein [Gemmatimonadetes bacterium]|nr:YceI family protein [Gemmatimonadota bacterium]